MRINIIKHHYILYHFLGRHPLISIHIRRIGRKHQPSLHNTIHNYRFISRPIVSWQVTSRPKSINTGGKYRLTILPAHLRHINTKFKIYKIIILTTPEVNRFICYPPLTFPCFCHLIKGINQVHVVIGDQFGRLLYRTINIRTKMFILVFIIQSNQVLQQGVQMGFQGSGKAP